MKKLYAIFLTAAIAISLAAPSDLLAQRNANKTDPPKKTKTVRGCEYEIVPGLAQITSVKINRVAKNSLLKYNEHEVWFKFTPMEGDELIDQIKDTEIEFVLRSSTLRIPVGPEYIKDYRVKKGTKYAMNLLQTRDREACPGELYTYESKALPNDLFEADREDNLYLFKKKAYTEQQVSREKEYEENKGKQAETAMNDAVSPVDNATNDKPKVVVTEDTPDYSTLTEEEMRQLVEKKLREELASGKTPSLVYEEPNERKLREETEARLRKEYEEELINADNPIASTESNTAATASINKNAALKEAKRKAKELERKKREDERRKQQIEQEQRKKEEALKAKIETEIRAKIEIEIAEKKKAALKANQDKKRIEQEHINKKRKALEKMAAIKKELLERITNETERKKCTFGERIAGLIEIIKVSKVVDAAQSSLGHTEYEVMVTFRPDNFAELSKKEKKEWETPFVFTLDPMGKNANPGAGYIRKYKVFKGTPYKGFVQKKNSGICNDIMVYSPDLPNDVSKIKLK